jgi:hypothetical protein
VKKLKLNLDLLRVDSFETAAPTRPHGTVQGYATRRADSCGCAIYTDGCSIGCPVTSPGCDTDGDTQPDPWSNNCWTTIEN